MSSSLSPQEIIDQLLTAIRADDVEKLQALLSAHQVDVDTQFFWNTALFHSDEESVAGFLHVAVYENSHKVMKWLIGQGIDIDKEASLSWYHTPSPLALAGMLLSHGRPKEKIGETIDILLAAGANPTALLIEMAAADDLAGVKRAVEAGADVNGDNNKRWGWKALHYAACHNNLPMIEYLIAHKADVDVRHTDTAKSTSLMLATSKGHTDAMRRLLKHNADPGLLNAKGASIFHEAAHARHNTDEILDILSEQTEKPGPNLINRPAPVNPTSNWSGLTPLAYAVAVTPGSGNAQTIAAFIRHGAHWQDLNADGQSILHILISRARNNPVSMPAEIIEHMLEAGIDPFLRNKAGVTADEASHEYQAIEKVFKSHCKLMRRKAEHFTPATDPLLDARGKPTGLLWYACHENLLAHILQPARWTGQENRLIAAKTALAKALPEPYAKQYDALLDVTALRRGSARKPASWLKRYVETPPERRARNE